MGTPKFVDDRQVLHRASLQQLGSAASNGLDDVLSKLNTELNYPLRPYASFPTADAKLNFSSAQPSAADGAKKSVSPLNGTVPTTPTAAFINFQTQAVSNAGDFNITWPGSNTVGRYRRVAFQLISTGKIDVQFSAEALTQGALADPGTLFTTGQPLGYVDLICTSTSGFFKTANSSSNIIENADVYRIAPGGGGSSTTSLTLTRRDESSAATLNSMSTANAYVKLTATVTTINGLASGSDGKIVIIENATGSAVILNNQSGSASASDRLALPDSQGILLQTGVTIAFIYDSGQSRWVPWGASQSLKGPLSRDSLSVTGALSITASHMGRTLAVAASSNFSLTLPAPSSLPAGSSLVIQDVNGNLGTYQVTLDRTAGGNIMGLASNYILEAAWGKWILWTDGTNWFLI